MERERRLIDAAVGAARQGEESRYGQLLAALAGGGLKLPSSSTGPLLQR